MVLRCPKLFRYRTEILAVINRTFGTKLELAGSLWLLGSMEGIGELVNIKTVVARRLFQARKLIAQNWQSVRPPTPEEWVKVVNTTLWKEKWYLLDAGISTDF